MLLMGHQWPWSCGWARHIPGSFMYSFLIGLTPLCENMPSGKANKPGDVVKAKNGKTIQVCKWKTQPYPSWCF